jgi:hypothetical protein
MNFVARSQKQAAPRPLGVLDVLMCLMIVAMLALHILS